MGTALARQHSVQLPVFGSTFSQPSQMPLAYLLPGQAPSLVGAASVSVDPRARMTATKGTMLLVEKYIFFVSLVLLRKEWCFRWW